MIVLAMLSTPPHRTDGMDHVGGRQTVAAGQTGLTGGATAQRAAFLKKFRTSRPVNGAIHASPSEQAWIGRIDDRVHRAERDIALDHMDAATHGEGSHRGCEASFSRIALKAWSSRNEAMSGSERIHSPSVYPRSTARSSAANALSRCASSA